MDQQSVVWARRQSETRNKLLLIYSYKSPQSPQKDHTVIRASASHKPTVYFLLSRSSNTTSTFVSSRIWKGTVIVNSHSAVFKFGGLLRLLNINFIRQEKSISYCQILVFARFSYDLQIWNGWIVKNWVLFHLSSCKDCFPSWNSQFRF